MLEDGQQRLVTFTILARAFSVIIDKNLKKISEPDLVKEMEDLSKELKLIYKEKPKSTNSPEVSKITFSRQEFENVYRYVMFDEQKPHLETRSEIQIDACYRYFLNIADSLLTKSKNDDYEDFFDFTSTFLNNCMFQVTDLNAAKIDKYLTFDAINSRGLKLTQFDKVKNYALFIENLGFSAVKITKDELETKWYDTLKLLGDKGLFESKWEDIFINDFLNVWKHQIHKIDDTHSEFRELIKGMVESPGTNVSLCNEFEQFIKLWTEYAESFAFISSKLQPDQVVSCRIRSWKTCNESSG